MTDLRQAAQQALEALEEFCEHQTMLRPIEKRESLKAALAEPVQEQRERELNEALTERDDAEDYIDALLDEVLGPDRAEWSSAYGRADALEEVRERIAQMLKPSIDKAWNRFEAALEQQAQPVQEPVVFKDAPERIWLQACQDNHCEVPFREHDEITWCAEQQNPLDVQYVRADLAAPPKRKPLSEDEIFKIENDIPDDVIGDRAWTIWFARAIERAHGIGGEG